MATKKIAKVASYEKVIKVIMGNPIMYFGSSDKPFNCPVCSRGIVKGIIYEKDSKKACSRNCIKSFTEV